MGLFLQVEGGMDYKAKAVAGLLAATCVFSIIALILSVVNVKDVFLPPSTKVGYLEGAHLPAFAWLPLGIGFSPGFRQVVLFVTEVGTTSHAGSHARWVWQSLITVTGPTEHTAFSSQNIASSKDL